MKNNNSKDHFIILFDGICNFCNSSVNFIIDRDKKDIFRFASIQSKAGQAITTELNIDKNQTDSIILVENSCYFIRSTAALRISRKLNRLWKLFYVFIIVPRPLRDFLYDIVAKNRYKWFGKSDSCRIPTPAEIKKFIE